MGAIASQITSLTIVYSIVNSAADQRKHQSSALLAFVRGIHRWPVNSPHKGPVTRKMFPFDDWRHRTNLVLRGGQCSVDILPKLHIAVILFVKRITLKEFKKVFSSSNCNQQPWPLPDSLSLFRVYIFCDDLLCSGSHIPTCVYNMKEHSASELFVFLSCDLMFTREQIIAVLDYLWRISHMAHFDDVFHNVLL